MVTRISAIVESLAARIADWPKKLQEGRFTSYCKQQGFDGPCKACAEKGLKSPDASVRGMSSFFINTVLKKKQKKSE
jgi:hypothetical protein